MATDWKRGISKVFMEDLKSGVLKPVLDLVQADHTLNLSIRKGYINVYYRGGSLMNIRALEANKHSYAVRFDENYGSVTLPGLPQPDYAALAAANNQIADWIRNVPLLKSAMDIWFGEHPKPEREFQQLVERTNNRDYRTDYFICDVEYTHPDCTELRADLVALHWPSTQASRRQNETRIAIIEMKYRNGAMHGSSGIAAHVRKLAAAVREGRVDLVALAQEMCGVFNQRAQLDLVQCHSDCKCPTKEVMPGTNDKPEFILLLADNDPDSGTLQAELSQLSVDTAAPDFPFDVKIATASCMGYGLFTGCIYPIAEFLAPHKTLGQRDRTGSDEAR